MEGLIDSVAGTLAGYGVLGAWAMYLMWQSWQKDKLLEKREDRIANLMDRSVDREVETVKVLTELATLVRALGSSRT